ncbi:FadR/GntR family transcriptional regulator [Scopulibacillus darangshiensis]|uniref:FadR/GntR family transcriptional regulator n=1 Tax=Scopulibacillus darangshiensis TaxID=442528 RepID=UPI001048226C|nr:FadR/GntR family transcriptional regulator [Scopulibacillus darangshiensis]
MQYKQIKSKKIYEVVADELVQMIKKGTLKPGDKLDSVQQLAENFQVGRSAVREALSALRAMGLVEMKQGEGTYIKEYDPGALSQSISTAVLMNQGDVKDLLEIRKILEVGAAGSASASWQEKDLDIIEEALSEMKMASGDQELGEKADLTFHMGIANASHNKLLVHLMNSVSETMAETMKETRRIWIYSKETTSERLYQEHKSIFEAIERRDATKAQHLMLAHLVEVEKVLMAYFGETDENASLN